MNLKILTELDRILKNNPALKNDKHAFCQVINGVFDIELVAIGETEITSLAEQIDKECLRNYFSNVWQAETKKYKYSGLAIIDEVNAMNPDNVVDIGCGFNEFKGKIDNLVGIDPYNDKADFMIHTLDYKPHIEYDKDWEYDEHGNHRYTGKYRKYVGKQRILILSEEDRLDYLLKYCIKNFYIAGANQVSNGKFVPKWKHEYELEKKEKEFNGVRDVSITIDGTRYKVI